MRGSGLKVVQGSINKHGNPRIRRALIEMAWRVTRFQPHYGPVVKWKEALAKKSAAGKRKKAIVAIGRQLAIDLWRLHTGRRSLADLNLI